MAVFCGNGVEEVRLINKEVQLTTDVFNYDLGQDLGYYTNGGTLADTANVLSPRYTVNTVPLPGTLSSGSM